MRTHILSIIILLFGNCLFSQSVITGEYCRIAEGIFVHIKKHDKCITFLPEQNFEFYNSYDYQGTEICEYGAGKYIISEDTISLYFEEFEKPKNSFDIEKGINPQSDSICIDLQLSYQDDSTSMSFAIVNLLDSKDKENANILSSYNTDFFGYVDIKLPKLSRNMWLEIQGVYISKSIIEISNELNYKITGYIVTDGTSRINGEIRRYLILSKKKNMLRIKNLDDNNVTVYSLRE